MARIAIALSMFSLLAGCAAPSETNRNFAAGCEIGPAQTLGPVVNSAAFDGSPTVSADGTQLFFTSERKGRQDLFVSTRSGPDAPWGEPVNLGAPIDDPTAGDFSLRLSQDGRALFFASTRSGGSGKADMYVATRASPRGAWGPAANLGPLLNTELFEAFPTPSPDGKALYFNRSSSFDSQDSDIWVSTRATTTDPWRAPQRLPAEINSAEAEFSPSLSTDGNTLFFASARSGSIEIWVSTRAHLSRPWGTPRKLGASVNVPGAMTLAPFIADNNHFLYFMSARPDSVGNTACTPLTCFDQVDLYVATVNCLERKALIRRSPSN